MCIASTHLTNVINNILNYSVSVKIWLKTGKRINPQSVAKKCRGQHKISGDAHFRPIHSLILSIYNLWVSAFIGFFRRRMKNERRMEKKGVEK